MITKEDVLQVSNALGFIPTDLEIELIVKSYEGEANSDPTGSVNLWIENLLYSFEVVRTKNKRK